MTEFVAVYDLNLLPVESFDSKEEALENVKETMYSDAIEHVLVLEIEKDSMKLVSSFTITQEISYKVAENE